MLELRHFKRVFIRAHQCLFFNPWWDWESSSSVFKRREARIIQYQLVAPIKTQFALSSPFAATHFPSKCINWLNLFRHQQRHASESDIFRILLPLGVNWQFSLSFYSIPLTLFRCRELNTVHSSVGSETIKWKRKFWAWLIQSYPISVVWPSNGIVGARFVGGDFVHTDGMAHVCGLTYINRVRMRAAWQSVRSPCYRQW